MVDSTAADRGPGPLHDLDDRESVFDPVGGKTFRDYHANVRDGVREFYRLNHANQTLAFVLEQKRRYLPKTRAGMGVWEALEFLKTPWLTRATPTPNSPRLSTCCRRPRRFGPTATLVGLCSPA